MRRLFSLAVLLSSMMAMVSPLTASAAGPAGSSVNETPTLDKAQVSGLLSKLMKSNHIPGAAVVVFDRTGVVWSDFLGKADLKKGIPVTASTLFRVGSITKTFDVVALLQLADQGGIKLSAPLRDVAPEIPFTNPWRKMDPVTVAQVLQHTAGFDDTRFIDAPENSRKLSLHDVLKLNRPELRVRWRPGSRMAYSNVDYLVAGYLIEKLSGTSYENYLTQHVLRPLDMPGASLAYRPGSLPDLAQGYVGPGMQPVVPRPILPRPAGALIASAPQLAHLGIMLLNDGAYAEHRLLPAADVTRMQTPSTGAAARHGLRFGYGLGDYTSYIDGHLFHGHDGDVGGFSARLRYSPKQGAGFIILVNTHDDGMVFRNRASSVIVKHLLGKMAVSKTPPVAITSKQRQALVGYYKAQNPNQATWGMLYDLNGVAVSVDGEQALRIAPLFILAPFRLLNLGHGLWRSPQAAGANAVSFQSAGGRTKIAYYLPSLGAGELYLVRVSAFSAYAPVAGVLLALVLMLSSVLFFPVWGLRVVFGRMREVRYWSVRLLPLVAILSWAAMLGVVALVTARQPTHPMVAESVNVYTVSYFVLSILFAVLSVIALIQALRSFRWPVNRWLRWHSLLVSAACIGLAAYLGYWGMIAFRMWIH